MLFKTMWRKQNLACPFANNLYLKRKLGIAVHFFRHTCNKASVLPAIDCFVFLFFAF